MKQCYLGKKPRFKANRRIEWQLKLRSLRLTEATELCPNCRCFWKEHDQEKCQGVGTKEDNLWVTHKHYYQAVMEILKRIIADSGSKDPQPCHLCSDEALHDGLECLRMAQYQPLELLDCEVVARPPMGQEEVIRLQQNSLLWIEEDTEGRLVVKSRIPRCCFCNRAHPTHFPMECPQAWEDWDIWRYPCYKCKLEGANHVSEECCGSLETVNKLDKR